MNRPPGPVAQALQGLVIGRLTWWFGWPFAILGAAGLAVTWTNLSTLIRYERLKAAATVESQAHVSELPVPLNVHVHSPSSSGMNRTL